jgi:hypothetical protein
VDVCPYIARRAVNLLESLGHLRNPIPLMVDVLHAFGLQLFQAIEQLEVFFIYILKVLHDTKLAQFTVFTSNLDAHLKVFVFVGQLVPLRETII